MDDNLPVKLTKIKMRERKYVLYISEMKKFFFRYILVTFYIPIYAGGQIQRSAANVFLKKNRFIPPYIVKCGDNDQKENTGASKTYP